MPGPPSKHAKYRPKVEELLRAGLQPSEISRRMPDVPRATIYGWAKQITGPAGGTGDAIAPDQVVDGKGQLIPFRPQPPAGDQHNLLADYQQIIHQLEGSDSTDLPDFLLIQREMRRLVSTSPNPAIQIQAGNLLARMIQLRAEIPRHILNEESQSHLAREMGGLDTLSDDELARQYKDLLG